MRTKILAALGIALFILCLFALPFSPAKGTQIINIPDGSTLTEAGGILKGHHLISSVFLFKVSAYILGGRHSIQAGDYSFDKPENMILIAHRLVKGISELALEKITIPEGYTNVQIADAVSKKFPLFNSAQFLAIAPQGYLFPDTYYFYADVSAKGVSGRMQDVFNTKTADLKADAASQKRNFANVVVLASILEEEVQTPEDKAIVAGILLNRLAIGMPLQVDSATTTYDGTGIPSTPISNPGLESLQAVLHPTETKYLYYLSDKSGKIHYAETFAEHEKNRELYLNK